MAHEKNGAAGPDRAETISDNRFTWPEERPAGIAASQLFDNIQGSLPGLSHEDAWVPASTAPLRDAPVTPARTRER